MQVVVHPECRWEVCQKADALVAGFVGGRGAGGGQGQPGGAGVQEIAAVHEAPPSGGFGMGRHGCALV